MKPKPLVLTCSKGDSHFRYGDGSLKDDQRQRKLLAAALRGLPDGAYELEIRPFEQTRRARANRYYWGVVLKLMAEELHQSAEDVHEISKMRHCFKMATDPATGEELKIAQSTARLTVTEFAEYLDRVMLDGAEYLGLTFPEPRASEEYREKERAA